MKINANKMKDHQEINVICTVKSVNELFFQVAPVQKKCLEAIKTFRPGKILIDEEVKCGKCSDKIQVNFFWNYSPTLQPETNEMNEELSVNITKVKVENVLVEEDEEIEDYEEVEYLENLPIVEEMEEEAKIIVDPELSEETVEIIVAKTEMEEGEIKCPVNYELDNKPMDERKPNYLTNKFYVPDTPIVHELITHGICDFCGYARKQETVKAFLIHCASHLVQQKNKIYCCHACNEGFDALNTIRVHALRCKNRESYRDRWEELASDDDSNTQRFKEYYRREPKVMCEICSKYMSKQQLKIHLMRHEKGNKLFSCNECDKEFTALATLKEHLIMRHFPQLATHKCPECPQIFTQTKRLDLHLKSKHLIGDIQTHTCPHCNLILANPATLKNHILKIHTDPIERPQFPCDECEKIFYSKNQLKTHQMTHLPEDQRPFKCLECGKTFISKYRHKQHIMEHIDPEVLLRRCEVCGKGFKHANSLTVHMRIHTGERPHHCKFCDKRFSDKSHYRVHLKQHEAEYGVKLTLTPEERRLVKLKIKQPEELISNVILE